MENAYAKKVILMIIAIIKNARNAKNIGFFNFN